MPPTERQILITEGQTVDKSRLTSKGRIAPPFRDLQQRHQLRQVFPPNTWLIDLVCFKDEELRQKFWYVFFVEANTRYLICIPANGNYISESWEETTPRINKDLFMNHFKAFQEQNVVTKIHDIKAPKQIYQIIGDSEKAFWTSEMQKYYTKNKIKFETVNVSREGHTRLSILDRIVRTIRGYLLTYAATAEDSEDTLHPTPDVLRQLVESYNETMNSRLRYEPVQLHNNPDLEKLLVLRQQAQNFYKKEQDDYELPIESKVQARVVKTDKFGKETLTVDSKPYIVVERGKGGLYTLKRGKETVQKWRRDLRPVPNKSKSKSH